MSFFSYVFKKGQCDISYLINGILGALVGITGLSLFHSLVRVQVGIASEMLSEPRSDGTRRVVSFLCTQSDSYS